MTGLRPGSYVLYSWQARGYPYRDPLFMKKYEVKGTLLRVEENGLVTTELRVLDDPPEDFSAPRDR
jgi:hypothetical protein